MYTGIYVKYSCQILKKLELTRQIFEKYPNIKFHENSSGGSRVVPCGPSDGEKDMQTYNDDEANSRFEQFFERS